MEDVRILVVPSSSRGDVQGIGDADSMGLMADPVPLDTIWRVENVCINARIGDRNLKGEGTP
jgi:hypothetical protein